ncbi:hypothetical protein CONLIGDRAFT_685687 [Coniochaeta ligniaria NRRL 30616]|uniref:Zn(2)-C6 fungal-type domain-containing protein n=1 Tax=Coniochaeta ligniaria NRRL 30616 TaxID=1408157 RepID=A0A1J7J6F6_9PEZI|nr:hypothetical protein CONLIGDRAFT_685687 [Coniochaeta ligniaria NRRL 30616]
MENGSSDEKAEAALKPDSSKWCWECRRRRLVCDCTRPVCNKCKTTGVVCPGYEDKKPLTWLAPGRVLYRPRKPRGRPPASQKAVVKKGKNVPSSSESNTGPSSQEVTTLQSVAALPHAQLRTDMCDLVEAAMYCKTGPLQLPLLSLWAHFKHEVFFRLTSRHSDNTALYPEMIANQLAPNPFVVPVLELRGLPTPLQHSLVAMSLGHRIYRSTAGVVTSTFGVSSESTQKVWWARLHYHRGQAIHLMNEAIGREDIRATDGTITTVLVFLMGELQQSISSAWRHHVNGLMALFKLRGGFDKITRSVPYLKPAMFAFLLIIVAANTTSPASDQVAVASFVHVIGLIKDLYGMGIYPPFPCAEYLFLDMGSINHLRARTVDPVEAENNNFKSLVAEAHSLLDHISAFSPEEWAEANSSEFKDEWLLVARIYHCAVTLYCISSLQSLGLLPSTPQMQTRRAGQRDRLMVLLAEGFASPLLKKSLIWPLVVAGFEAGDGSDFERRFVATHLEDQSRELGSSQPLVAKAVFERFWSGGKTRWDDCFDRPYAFLV